MVLFCDFPLSCHGQPIQLLIDSGHILRVLPDGFVKSADRVACALFSRQCDAFSVAPVSKTSLVHKHAPQSSTVSLRGSTVPRPPVRLYSFVIAKAYRLYKEYGPEQYVQILQLLSDTWNGAAWSVTGYLLGGVAVFLREYGEEYSRTRFIKRLRSATYETLRDEARRQQRGSSDVAHALAVTKLYNLTGGRGTVDPRRLTVLD